ncbi:phytoene/squalene synthase family protein [Rubrivirga marina]|uniref:phytoene/squalene synthase family protein n=1 Tax=Rubrivirga marina TaxID=1196024 RepID=UPI000BA91129|nr:phytoene/squalene synthase family protein [Rubrivirga marina]
MEIASPLLPTLAPATRKGFAAPEAPPEGATRREEDRYLRRAFRHHSRTFSLATRLLPRPERLPVATLYLYCRTVDSLADERAVVIGPDRALAEVDALEAALDQTLAGRPPTGPHALLWRRLAEVHAAYDLPALPLRQLLDGARWDLRGRTVETRADLLAYADLVAGSVGAAMLPFLVRDDADRARLDAPARALGNAMQLTNILRDVGEDCRDLGRCYLPTEDLDRHGLDLDALVDAGPPVPDAYAALCEGLMAEAERLYDEGGAAIPLLRRRAQPGIHGAARMYREFLNGVRANGYDNLSRRAAVPLRRKLRVLLSNDYAVRRDRLATAAR